MARPRTRPQRVTTGKQGVHRSIARELCAALHRDYPASLDGLRRDLAISTGAISEAIDRLRQEHEIIIRMSEAGLTIDPKSWSDAQLLGEEYLAGTV